jgi:hypothetical protein
MFDRGRVRPARIDPFFPNCAVPAAGVAVRSLAVDPMGYVRVFSILNAVVLAVRTRAQNPAFTTQ